MKFAFEGHSSTLTVLLFRDVENSKELREAVVTGRVEPEFAFINAAVVPGLLPLQLSAHRALTNQARGKLVTRTLHAELVYGLSGSKHIGESLKRCGVADGATDLLVARFDAADADLERARQLVRGREAPIAEELPKVAAGAAAEAATRFFKVAAPELQVGGMEDAVACRIATRDCG